MAGLLYPGVEQYKQETAGQAQPGLLRTVLESLASPEQAMGLGFTTMGGELVKPPSVPQPIKDHFFKKVLRAIITNQWDDLTPFLKATARKYGLGAAQDMAQPMVALPKAYKLAGADPSGYRMLMKLHGPIYDKIIQTLY